MPTKKLTSLTGARPDFPSKPRSSISGRAGHRGWKADGLGSLPLRTQLRADSDIWPKNEKLREKVSSLPAGVSWLLVW